MSEENNIYEDNNTQAPVDNTVYSSEPVNYGSGKGQGKGLGIASMICGIVSLIGCCGAWYIGVPCGIVAIILGIVQIVKNESKGMAIAGIVCGAIGGIMGIIWLVAASYLMSTGIYEELMSQYGSY